MAGPVATAEGNGGTALEAEQRLLRHSTGSGTALLSAVGSGTARVAQASQDM